MKIWAGFLLLVCALWLHRRLQPRWVIVPPDEVTRDMLAQWEDLKRTGIGPGHPDF